MITQEIINTHFENLASAIGGVKTDGALYDAYNKSIRLMRGSKKIIFIGNGGSASIASHMAEDYTKNGKLRSIAFNDASLLTCLANDYGYENVFGVALNLYADKGDVLVAISSSGKSQNILSAVKIARSMGLSIITLSGFDSSNPLRKMGDVNFWVNAASYGMVEITHLAVLHSILDMICEGK